MKIFLRSFIFLLIGIQFSCEKEVVRNSVYYPVDSLISAQVNFLAEMKATVMKKAEIDGIEEQESFTLMDSTAWAHELDIFYDLSIVNQATSAGKYSVETIADSNSNLSIRSFTCNESLPIVYIKLFYLGNLSKIKRLEALYREENSLLKGSRYLILEFHEIHNKTVLTSYSIEGSQKMFLGDSVKFSIQGSITVP